MSDRKTRVIVLVVAVIVVIALLVAGILACRSGVLLARNQPTATPTKTPKPTFTITSTATNTPVPTDTATPTSTATATPLATNTPIVYTATPTPTPTDTETPTPTNTATRRPAPTNTRRPRATATPAPPTNTPAPQFPWRGEPAGIFANCGLTAFMGLTLDRNGAVAGDIVVHYWADGWEGAWAVSSWTVDQGYPGQGDEKNWDGILKSYAADGVWKACVVASQGSFDCISDTMLYTSVSSPCEPDSGGVQVFRIVFRKN